MGTGSVQIGLESLFLEGRGETLQSLCCGDCTVSLLAGNRKSYLHHRVTGGRKLYAKAMMYNL